MSLAIDLGQRRSRPRKPAKASEAVGEPRRRGRWAHVAPPLIVLGAWTALSASGLFPREIVVPPQQIWATFVQLWGSGELPGHLAGSLSRLATGYGLGAAIGIALGVLMGLSRQAEAYILPSFQVMRQLPTIALIPAFIMIFGVGETVKIILVAKATALPVALATFQGVRGIPKVYFDVGRLYRVGPVPLFLKVVIPATVPPVITGLRIALARSWMVLVGAELLVADSGLGQLMEWGRQTFRIDIVLMGVVLTGLIGFTLDKGFRAGERALSPARARGGEP
ncbi:ABC transporter permease [Phenylobacterium sp.]|jgi:sulfonate transport system permease protein|uniref:ABC transporter permease n=1 Tax=Phenylobacterium sp. TaxID=1871053 RepID=UPI003783C3B8